MNFTIFAERLNDLIFDNKLTVKSFINKIELPKTTVYEYLSGKKMPTINNAIKIAKFFSCSLDYLFGIESNYYPFSFNEVKPFTEVLSAFLSRYILSRYKLQQLTNISSSTLYYWAKGITQPNIENLYVIATKFNCSIDYLAGITEQ